MTTIPTRIRSLAVANNPFTIEPETRELIREAYHRARAGGVSKSRICYVAGMDPGNLDKVIAGTKPLGIITAVRLCTALRLKFQLAVEPMPHAATQMPPPIPIGTEVGDGRTIIDLVHTEPGESDAPHLYLLSDGSTAWLTE